MSETPETVTLGVGLNLIDRICRPPPVCGLPGQRPRISRVSMKRIVEISLSIAGRCRGLWEQTDGDDLHASGLEGASTFQGSSQDPDE
jgi:hypothetical protein